MTQDDDGDVKHGVLTAIETERIQNTVIYNTCLGTIISMSFLSITLLIVRANAPVTIAVLLGSQILRTAVVRHRVNPAL